MYYSVRDILSTILSILTAIATIIAGFATFKRLKEKPNDSSYIEKALENIRKQEKNENSKNIIEEEKYALFLQYHSQGLSQSRISFWFSLIFASIGFAIIVIGILSVQDTLPISNQGKAFISMLSGTVIDGVSALFFVQSNKARQLMIDFFDKLRADRKFDESLRLADQIPDNHLKSKIKILLSLNFADIKTSDGILNLILNGIEQQNSSDQKGI